VDVDVIVTVLQRIAELLSPTAEAAWRIALVQVGVQARVSLAWGIVGVVLMLLGGGAGLAAPGSKSIEAAGWWYVLAVVLLITGAILAGRGLTNAYQYMASPEWYAIQALMGLVP